MKTTKLCGRCEALPEKIEGGGRLFVWLPLGHSFNKVINFFLRHAGESCQVLGERQCVLTAEDEADVQSIARSLCEQLTGEEIKDTNVLFVAGTGEPQFADFARMGNLKKFAAMSQAGWLVEMLADSRVTSHFQPIVHSGEPSRVFAQEALLRGIETDGSIVSPGRILDLCRDADLLFQVDLLARRTAVRLAGQHKIDSKIFINFNPTAIYDPTFCLRSTVRAIDEVGIQASSIVFEVTESDRSQDEKHLQRILEYYRNAGFGVALDDVGSGYSSLNLIHKLRPDYIKLDMDLIRNIHKDECKAVIAAKLFEMAQSLDIKTVAEGIETIEELEWVTRHGADFVQGYFIAKPAAHPITNPFVPVTRPPFDSEWTRSSQDALPAASSQMEAAQLEAV